MKRFAIALLAASAAGPALAQHQGHHMPGMAMPAPPPKAKPRPAIKKPPVKTAPKPAAGDPHAGHIMPPAEAPAADPHAGHDRGATAAPAPAPPAGPPPPGAFSGPARAADTLFDPAEIAAAHAQLMREHGGVTVSKVMFDQLETRIGGGRDGYFVNGDAYHGGDIDKAWLKFEGEGRYGRKPEQAEVQALWSHAIGPWFDLQAGLRYDFRPDPERVYLVVGVQGLAPYWFEVEPALFVSDKGDVSARLEAEYDQRITGKLILQPRVELDLALQDVPETGVGAGLSKGEAGLRLRYEVVPEFAPYVGVNYARAFGDTADFARAAGDDVGGWSLLVGIRAWF